MCRAEAHSATLRHGYIVINTANAGFHPCGVFPTRDHAKLSLQTVCGRKCRSGGCDWNLQIIMHRTLSRNRVLKHESHQWVSSGATHEGSVQNQTLGSILHAPRISGPTGCTLSKLETMLQALVMTDASSPRLSVSHVQPVVPTVLSFCNIICKSTFPTSSNSSRLSDLWNCRFFLQMKEPRENMCCSTKEDEDGKGLTQPFKLVPLSLVEFLAVEPEDIFQSFHSAPKYGGLSKKHNLFWWQPCTAGLFSSVRSCCTFVLLVVSFFDWITIHRGDELSVWRDLGFA